MTLICNACGYAIIPGTRRAHEPDRYEALAARHEALRTELEHVAHFLSKHGGGGSTHWSGCEDDPRHWRCAMIARIRAALQESP